MSERKNIASLVMGSILILAGAAFLALNIFEFQISWLRTLRYVIPGLLLIWGLIKLYRHFFWEHEQVLRRPGRAGLLSGLFWTAVGLTMILDLAETLEGLDFFGLYWPFILVLFGLGRILDYYRLDGRLHFRPAEAIGVLFIILIGVLSGWAAEAHFPLIQLPIEIGDDGNLRLPEVMGKSFSWETEEVFDAARIETLDLSNLYGDVEVVGSPSDSVRIRLTKEVLEKDESAALKVAEQINLESSSDGPSLSVWTNRANLTTGKKRFKTHFRVELPPEKAVKVSNAYGDVSVRSLGAPCEVNSEYGKVQVEEIGADVAIRNRYSTAAAREIQGNLTISNHRGRVEAKDIYGNADLSTDYDTILARRVEGNLKASNQFGKFEVGEIRGTLDLDGPGSEIEVSDVEQKVTVKTSHKTFRAQGIKDGMQVESSYGRLLLTRISGPVQIGATHSEITAEEIQASITVEAVSSKISLRAIEGTFKLATSLREVSVDGFHAGGEIQNEYGEIIVSPDGPLEGNLTAENKNGQITLRVSPDSSFRLSAVAKGGSIVSDFGTASSAREEKSQALEVQIGRGGPAVRLLTTFAPINIKKQ